MIRRFLKEKGVPAWNWVYSSSVVQSEIQLFKHWVKTPLPQDFKGWGFLLVSTSFGGSAYLGRLQVAGFFLGTLGTWLNVFYFIYPVLFLVGFLGWVLTLYIYTFRFQGHAAPRLILYGLLLLAFILPVPPSPEEIIFFLRRADYERIVELGRSHQLQQDGACVEPNLFLPPAGYYQLSSECIYADQQDGLIVEIATRSLERPVVYLENPTRGFYSPCARESGSTHSHSETSYPFKQLSEHWFICRRWPERQP